MWSTVEFPLWFVVLAGVLALIGLVDRLLIPSVRWFFRKRFNKAIDRLNKRLQLRIQPFKLTRRRVLIDRLSHDPVVMEAVAKYAKENNEPVEVIAEQAHRYTREIVPYFSAFAYFGFAARACRWLSQALYRVRLGYMDEDTLGKIDQDSTVVFVMNHRSNMDYVLVTYLASSRSALSYAVGEWARVWPLQGFIRSMGAYFIRRKSRNNLYRCVLARYVQMATEGGVTQAIFPEGGLSRDGHLGEAKLGLLSYIVKGFNPDGPRDVVFVPVGINYDRVLEDRVLLAARGVDGKKAFKFTLGSFLKFFFHRMWLRITKRYHRSGYAVVSFGNPLSLNTFLANRNDASPIDGIEELGANLMQSIAQVVPVVPVPLIAKIVLAADKNLSRIEIKAAAHDLLRYYATQNVHSHIPRGDEDYAVDVGLRMLLMRHILLEENGAFSINPENLDVLNYYANAIAHHPDGSS